MCATAVPLREPPVGGDRAHGYDLIGLHPLRVQHFVPRRHHAHRDRAAGFHDPTELPLGARAPDNLSPSRYSPGTLGLTLP